MVHFNCIVIEYGPNNIVGELIRRMRVRIGESYIQKVCRSQKGMSDGSQCIGETSRKRSPKGRVHLIFGFKNLLDYSVKYLNEDQGND